MLVDSEAVGKEILVQFEKVRTARINYEKYWDRCWKSYMPTAQLNNFDTAQEVGDVYTSWRHKLKQNEIFSLVETAHSYLRDTMFSGDWFYLVPQIASGVDSARLMSAYVKSLLEDQTNFSLHVSVWLRNFLVNSFSVLALPVVVNKVAYRYDEEYEEPELDSLNILYGMEKPEYAKKTRQAVTYKPDFVTLNNNDVWLDTYTTDPNQSNLFRVLRLTKTQVALRKKSLYFNKMRTDPDKLPGANTYPNWYSHYFENELLHTEDSDKIDIIEFWGNLEVNGTLVSNVVAHICGQTLLSYRKIPYHSGKPFIIANQMPLVDNPYGVPVVSAAVGIARELDLRRNHGLDVHELAINVPLVYVPDGVVEEDSLVVYPGQKIPAADPRNVQPLAIPQTTQLNFSEKQELQASISSALGIPPIIATGSPGRQAERVTAQEIMAQQQAGGNRLSGTLVEIENQFCKPLISKLLSYIAQFDKNDRIVAVATPLGTQYYPVTVDDFAQDFIVAIRGVTWKRSMAEKRQQLMEVVGFAMQNPDAMASQLNWEVILQKFTEYTIPNFPEDLFIPPEAESNSVQAQMANIYGDNGVGVANQDPNQIISELTNQT